MAGIDILLNVTSATVPSSASPAKNQGSANSSSEFGNVLADVVRQDSPATGSSSGRSSSASADTTPSSDRGTASVSQESGPESPKPAVQDAVSPNATDSRRDDQGDEPLAAEAAGSAAAASAQQTPQNNSARTGDSPETGTAETGESAAVVPLTPLPPQATLAAPASLAALVSDVIVPTAAAQNAADEGAIDVSSLAGTLVEELPVPPEATATVQLPAAAASASESESVVPATTPEVTPASTEVVVEVVVAVPETSAESTDGPNTTNRTAVSSETSPTAGVEVEQQADSTAKLITAAAAPAVSAKTEARSNAASTPELPQNNVPTVQAAAPVPVAKPVAATPVAAEVRVQPVASALPETGDGSETDAADAEAVVVDAKPAARVSVTGTASTAPAGLMTGLWEGVVVTGRAAERSAEPTNAASGEVDLSGGDWSQLLDGDPLNGVVPAVGQGGASPNGPSGVAGAAAVTGPGHVSAAKRPIEPVLDQVTSGVVSSHRGGHEVRLRLNPPELGSLLIDVAVREGVVTARLETSQAGTQQLLTDNIHQLRDALAQQGLVIDKLDVSLGDSRPDNSRGDQGSAGMSFSDGRSRDDQSAPAPVELPDELAGRSTKTAVPRPRYLGAGKSAGLDVEV